jgi:hypothetical protein
MKQAILSCSVVLVLLGCSTGTSPGGSGGAGAQGGIGSGGALGSGGTAGTAGPGSVPTISGCNIFPADNPWNTDISAYPLNANSASYLANMSSSTGFHPDWGTVTDEYGIPFSTGTGATPQPMTWNVDYGATESDQLPCASGGNKFCYPIPLTAPIEGGPTADTGSDRHVLYIDTAGAPDNCTLYEVYNAQNPAGGSGWTASNGAIFHLGSNALRTDGWTSADAAGLPVLPGLVRYDEVMAGEIRHAIRFTVSRSQQGYIHPATHAAGNSSTTLPPMGLRLRLKASFATSSFSGPTLVILTAMKKYGIILADNGSNWYISGETNQGWDQPTWTISCQTCARCMAATSRWWTPARFRPPGCDRLSRLEEEVRATLASVSSPCQWMRCRSSSRRSWRPRRCRRRRSAPRRE